jgi:hypothetical protein
VPGADSEIARAQFPCTLEAPRGSGREQYFAGAGVPEQTVGERERVSNGEQLRKGIFRRRIDPGFSHVQDHVNRGTG